jgi:hypothetical protein
MTMVNLATRVLVIASMAIWPIACGGSDSSTSDDSTSDLCTPGQTQACTCADESTGAQECDDPGTYLECVCSESSPCGNGTIDMGEQCEPGDVNGETCAGATMNARPNGSLACSSSCTFDVSGCTGTTSSTGGTSGTGGTGGTGGTMGGGATTGAGGLMGGGGLLGG